MFIVNPSRFTVAEEEGGGDPDPAATVTYVGRYRTTSGGSTHTITSDNIGSAEYVLVVFYRHSDTGSPTVSSVTIGGTAATRLEVAEAYAHWYIAAAPVDTTPNVVVTFSASANAVGMAIYGITNLSSTTPTDTDYSATNNANLSVSVEAGGFIVLSAFGNDGPSITFSSVGKHFTHEWYPDDGAEHVGWSQVSPEASTFSQNIQTTSAEFKAQSLAAFR